MIRVRVFMSRVGCRKWKLSVSKTTKFTCKDRLVSQEAIGYAALSHLRMLIQPFLHGVDKSDHLDLRCYSDEVDTVDEESWRY